MNAIDDLVAKISSEADRTLPDRFVRNKVHWFMSILLNRTYLRLNIGTQRRIVNYYGLTVAGSNSGKSWVMNNGLLSKFDQDIYKEVAKRKFKALSSIDGQKITKAREIDLKPIISLGTESTPQGIHLVGQAYSVLAVPDGGGSVNILNDEFFATTSFQLIDKLYEAYDGIFRAPIQKGDEENGAIYEDVTDVPVNMMAISSMAMLEDDKKKMESFITKLKQAMFRRLFVVIDDEKRKAKIGEEHDLSVDTSLLITRPFEEAIYSNEITISKEAFQLHLQTLDEFLDDDSEFANFRDAYKILNLAAIRAYGDQRLEISEDDYIYALEFEKECYEDALLFVSLKDSFTRAYHLLKRYKMDRIDFIRRGIIEEKDSQRQMKDLISNIKLRTFRYGDVLIQSDINTGGDVKEYEYHIETPKKATIVRVGYWNAPNDEYDAKVIDRIDSSPEGEFGERLADWMSGKAITPWLFNPEPTEGRTNRTKDNATKAYMICFDFEHKEDMDEDHFYMSLDMVKEQLAPLTMIIRSSRSHGKDERYPDRFHVYIPYEYEMELEAEVYKKTYINIAKALGIYDCIDRSTCHRASWFREVMEPDIIEYIEGEMRLDWRQFVPESTKMQEFEEAYGNIDETQLSEERRIRGMQKWALMNAHTGNRNNVLFRLAKMLVDINAYDPRGIVISTNARLENPLSETELNNTVLREFK